MPKLFGVIPVPGFGFNLAKSPAFAKQVRKVFDDADKDHDGHLEFSELYVAILKLYDNLNRTLPVRVRIPSTEEMTTTMARFDKDKSGKLSFPEFLELCQALVGAKGPFYQSLMFKACCVIAIKLLLIPLVAKGIKEGAKRLGVSHDFVDGVPAGALEVGLELAAKSQLPVPM